MISSGKKGNMVLDSIFVVVVLVILALFLLVGYTVLSDWNDEVQADPDFPEEGKNLTSSMTTEYHNAWDGAFLFLILCLWIVVMIASYLIDTHPVFFIIAFIAFAFVIVFAAYMSNNFYEFATDADMASAASAFPIMIWVLNHLVEVILGVGVSIAIVLYAKFKGR